MFLFHVDKEPVEVQNPDLPPVEVEKPAAREQPEPPQIKGPIEVPDRKKEEVVQLDRPDAGEGIEPQLERYVHPELCRISVLSSPRCGRARGRGPPP